jgi:c-di-GMP-related signal transduction protein
LKRSATILVAEKIETNEEFEMALGEGFGLFQGYYLGRPEVFSKRRASRENVKPSPSAASTELVHSHFNLRAAEPVS